MHELTMFITPLLVLTDAAPGLAVYIQYLSNLFLFMLCHPFHHNPPKHILSFHIYVQVQQVYCLYNVNSLLFGCFFCFTATN
jgi:hypothetical protein